MAFMLPIAAIGAGTGGWWMYKKATCECEQRRTARKQKGPSKLAQMGFAPELGQSGQPGSDPKDCMTYSSIGSGKYELIRSGPGIRGSTYYLYYLPESNTTVTTYRPIPVTTQR